MAEERQVSGRWGAHALTLAYVVVTVWCAMVHPWPGAAFYLGLMAAFLGLSWAWSRRARHPVPAGLVLAFVLANAALLTVTLLVPNPLGHQKAQRSKWEPLHGLRTALDRAAAT